MSCEPNDRNFCLTHGEYECQGDSGSELCTTGLQGLNSPIQRAVGFEAKKKYARQLDDRIIKSLQASSAKCGLLLSKESSVTDIGKLADQPQLINTFGKRTLESKGLK